MSILETLAGSAFWESDADIFVHACVESDISLNNQTSDFLRWKHIGGMESPHVSGKRVICGHTSQTDGVPIVFDGWACIDTYPHGGKWLTCLNVETDHVQITHSLTMKTALTIVCSC